jgi:hypothetical protein
MPAGVPPPPINSPNGSYYWLEWYSNLTNFLNGTNIPWANINFATSNIHDLVNRQHNSLTGVQGGNAVGDAGGSGNAWHITGRGMVQGGVGTGFPSGWTVSGSGSVYTITHNLNAAFPTLGAIATSVTGGVQVQYIDCSSTNQVVVHLSGTGDFTIAIFT